MVRYIDILIIFLILSLSACSKQTYHFGGGLRAVDFSSGNFAILDKNDNFIIVHKIEIFCKKNDSIIGYRVDPKGDNSDGSADFTENLGYFELNISTKKIVRNEHYGIDEVKRRCGSRLLP